MIPPRVIVVNGVGSVGKTSTCRALQRLLAEPFLHVQGDAFLGMMDPRLYGRPEGITVTQHSEESPPTIDLKIGPAVRRLMNGMRASVGTLVRSGNSCIVDDMMLCAGDQQVYVDACGAEHLHFVALHAPLHVVVKRERTRGDRILGLAQWQFDRVHRGIRYDLEIGTEAQSPESCALAIAQALKLPVLR